MTTGRITKPSQRVTLRYRFGRWLSARLREAIGILFIFSPGCATDLPRLSDKDPASKHASANQAEDSFPSAAEAGLASSD